MIFSLAAPSSTKFSKKLEVQPWAAEAIVQYTEHGSDAWEAESSECLKQRKQLNLDFSYL